MKHLTLKQQKRRELLNNIGKTYTSFNDASILLMVALLFGSNFRYNGIYK